jgi:choline dehydrogenase-like flavoprotein
MKGLRVALAAAAGMCATTVASAYDYIVVGGGTAGSIVATRLAATHSVLLLNIAGPSPLKYNSPVMISDELIVKKNLSATPGMSVHIHQPGYTPMPFFSTGETGSSPARWLGGSSLVGLSLFLYDKDMDWSPGWDGNIMQNYMLKSKIQPTHHPNYLHPLTRDFLKEVKEAKATPSSQRPDGTKITAHAAYIVNLSPSKLTIMENVRADRLIIDDGVCRGVLVRDLENGGTRSIKAAKEVIVSSGYLYTPKLLFLSGIGDAKDLTAAGLKVVKDMPAVGKNLTAPRFTPISWRTSTPTLSQMMGPPISKSGPVVHEAFQSVVAEATVHLGRRRRKQGGNAIAQFMPLYYAPKSAPLQYSLQGEPWPLETNAYTMLVTMATSAQGKITFDANPDVSPTITHDPLTPEDLKRGAEAVREAEKLGSRLSSEGRVEGEQDWSAVYDGRGTCRMGTDPHTSVVDPMLRVHGIKGLRIVDGSVLPSNTPYLAMPEVIMVAERAVDLILDVPTYAVTDMSSDESLRGAVSEGNTAAEDLAANFRQVDQSAVSVPLLVLLAACGAVATFVGCQRSQGVAAEADFYIQA